MQEIKIRLIEDHILAKLKTEADKKGIGLETLARTILTDHALNPEIRKIEDKYEKLVKDVSGLYRSMAEEMKEQLIENTKMLDRISFLIESGRRP